MIREFVHKPSKWKDVDEDKHTVDGEKGENKIL
jgi:hypothetical protein